MVNIYRFSSRDGDEICCLIFETFICFPFFIGYLNDSVNLLQRVSLMKLFFISLKVKNVLRCA